METTQSDQTSDCQACSAGKYGLDPAASCINCAAGRASNEDGSAQQSDCQACPAGHVAASEGANVCELCGAGTYHVESHQPCQVCPPGSYTDTLAEAGATNCTTCTVGKFAPNSTQPCDITPGLYGGITLDISIDSIPFGSSERAALTSQMVAQITESVDGVVDSSTSDWVRAIGFEAESSTGRRLQKESLTRKLQLADSVVFSFAIIIPSSDSGASHNRFVFCRNEISVLLLPLSVRHTSEVTLTPASVVAALASVEIIWQGNTYGLSASVEMICAAPNYTVSCVVDCGHLQTPCEDYRCGTVIPVARPTAPLHFLHSRSAHSLQSCRSCEITPLATCRRRTAAVSRVRQADMRSFQPNLSTAVLFASQGSMTSITAQNQSTASTARQGLLPGPKAVTVPTICESTGPMTPIQQFTLPVEKMTAH